MRLIELYDPTAANNFPDESAVPEQSQDVKKFINDRFESMSDLSRHKGLGWTREEFERYVATYHYSCAVTGIRFSVKDLSLSMDR